MGAKRLLVATAALLSVALAGASRAAVVTYTFDVWIDGQDTLLVSSDTLRWQYGSYQPVGETGPFTTTNISTTLNGAAVDSFSWQPMFAAPTSSGALSSIYTGLAPTLGAGASNLVLNVMQARESLTISQYPDASNGYTLGIDFDDTSDSGAGEYIGTVSFDDASVPEPGAWILMTLGLGTIGSSLRRRAEVRVAQPAARAARAEA